MEATEPMLKALAACPDAPVRVTDPQTCAVQILLQSADFAWIRELLGDEPDAPRVVDPRTKTSYAVIPETRYERFKAFFEEDPLSPAEKMALLREAGKRAGWNDPGMELLDEPATGKSP